VLYEKVEDTQTQEVEQKEILGSHFQDNPSVHEGLSEGAQTIEINSHVDEKAECSSKNFADEYLISIDKKRVPALAALVSWCPSRAVPIDEGARFLLSQVSIDRFQ